MKCRFLRCFVVVSLAAITLLFPLLALPHRIDEAHRSLIREGMTAAEVESIFGVPAGTYDWAVSDDSLRRQQLRYLAMMYLAQLQHVKAADAESQQEAAGTKMVLTALRDSGVSFDRAQSWTSRHGSVTIFFDNAGRVTGIGGWYKTRVEPPWKKWWNKIKGK